jgi:hypothetical protein
VLRISWLWLLLVAALLGGGGWLQWSWIVEAISEIQRGAPRGAPHMPLGIMLPVFAGYIVMMFAWPSIAVAWHRLIIIGESPRLSGSNLATGNLWRFIGVYLAIALAAFVPALIVAFAVIIGVQQLGSGAPGFLKLIGAMCGIVAYVMAIWILFRRIILLPARAIGDVTLTFKEAWKRTRGNVWRLFWGSMACTVVPVIPIYLVMLLGGGGFTPAENFSSAVFARTMVSTTIYIVYCLLMFPIFVGFLSHAYQHFFEEA